MSARRGAVVGALVAGGLIVGGVAAGSLAANAADSGSSTSTSSTTALSTGAASGTQGTVDESKSQRPDEKLLTGDTAAKVRAAALAKYPGATVLRVETDSDGVYEAHLTKSDGSRVTVEVDKSFTVTGDEAMPAGGPGGPGGPRGGGQAGQPDQTQPSASSTN